MEYVLCLHALHTRSYSGKTLSRIFFPSTQSRLQHSFTLVSIAPSSRPDPSIAAAGHSPGVHERRDRPPASTLFSTNDLPLSLGWLGTGRDRGMTGSNHKTQRCSTVLVAA